MMPCVLFDHPFPLFDRTPIIPVVPIKFHTAIGRGGGQGRTAYGCPCCRLRCTAGRRDSASPLTVARPMAGSRNTRRRGAVVAIVQLYLSATTTMAAHAETPTVAKFDVLASRRLSVSVAVEEAARRFGLPADLIRGVINAESGRDVDAVSPKGALGLMQLMPGTYRDMARDYGLGTDPFDIHDNLIAGTAYLRRLLDDFGSAGFLAAYHAGPRRFERHLSEGRALPQETLDYVNRLEPLVANLQLLSEQKTHASETSWTSAPLFVVRSEQRDGDNVFSAPSQVYGRSTVPTNPDGGNHGSLFPSVRAGQ